MQQQLSLFSILIMHFKLTADCILNTPYLYYSLLIWFLFNCEFILKLFSYLLTSILLSYLVFEMGKLCCVKKCPNSTGKPAATIHNFPTLQPLQNLWTTAIGNNMKQVSLSSSGVCSNHFKLEDYNNFWNIHDANNKKKGVFVHPPFPMLKIAQVILKYFKYLDIGILE